jgi:hypothetical protein
MASQRSYAARVQANQALSFGQLIENYLVFI